jgi:hypothetical protein
MGAIVLFAAAAGAAELAGVSLLAGAATEGALDLGAVGALGEGTSVASEIGTALSAEAATAKAAATIDGAATASTPFQQIKDTLQGVNNSINEIIPPGVRQGISTAYQLSKGADPTQVLLGSLKSQALSGLGSDIADVSGSKDLGQFTTGTISSLLSGQDPTKALTNSALGVVNSEFNTNLKDMTGLSALPNFNVSSLLNPTPTSPISSNQTSAPTQTSFLGRPNMQTNQQNQYNLQNTANLPTLGLAQLGMPNLALPTLSTANIGPASTGMAQSNAPGARLLMKDGGLAHHASGNAVTSPNYKVPKLSSLDDYTQLDTTLDPTEELVYNGRLVNPQQMSMLSAQPTYNVAHGGSIDHSKIIPELLEVLQRHIQPKHYSGADGQSSVTTDSTGGSESIWDNPDVKKIDWKALEASGTPKFSQIFQPKLLQPRANPMAPKLNPLGHLHQGPLNTLNPLTTITNPMSRYLTGRAHGGLAKYKEAAPKGHNPEFITGVTGYYAGGRGTGQSDDIPAMLHDGDYVMDADAVAAFGDGSSKAGNEALMKFLHQVPHHDHKDGEPVPAKIADGEVVLPEAFVTALGGGDNKHGAKMLDAMREELREHKRSAPTSKIPPKAKSPLEYLKMAKG